MILNGKVYQEIVSKSARAQNQLAILLDPDKLSREELVKRVNICQKSKVDYIFVGGSLITKNIDSCIQIIKDNSDKPVVIFPGHHSHISDKVDAILLLSLVSGRNAEFLIGKHVVAASQLYQSNLEIISTAYILIDGGRLSSVQYMSNTIPIPNTKPDIAVATAIAGEMIGNKLIYLEAGSGAEISVSNEIISAVKSKISCPLIVGGGIRNHQTINQKYSAGANIIVLGNIIEENPEMLMAE